MPTSHNLDRFIKAQQGVYKTALSEIRNGRKASHWMWFIFPQIQGLGHSDMARFYAIKDKEEAQGYLQHPILGQRLIEISEVLMQLNSSNAVQIFGGIDSVKLKSSMTLFSSLPNANPIFQKVLDKFFGGEKDGRTVEILAS
ncbi:MAG: calpastatin [Bacteroidetes bacterium 43-93]|nr:DUF1810 domain-containing protein [Bacteroidota bacterium]OJX00285.1 MAG: calpastatin [Bacteroidetes bacterium 43-93]